SKRRRNSWMESWMRSPRPAFLFVGWVERSETHRHRRPALMGFASLYPSYDSYDSKLRGRHHADWKLPVRKRGVRSRRRARDDRSLPLPHLPQDTWIGVFDRHQRSPRPLSLDQG